MASIDADDDLFRTTLGDELRAAFLPLGQLQELQRRRLRTLLDRAVQFVPLYRDLYRSHRDVLHGLKGPDDLWKLPAVSKEDYLRVGSAGYVDEREEPARLVHRTTSGSQGRALDLYASPAEARIHVALLWAGWMSQLSASDRLLFLAAPQLHGQPQHLPSAFLPVQTGAEETRRRFVELEPTAVIGSVEAISLLGRDLRRHEVSARRRVRKVFPFGQTLTPALEAMIREGFDAEIFNLYGTGETVWIAGECERHNGLHIPLERVIVQIARLNEPDRPAETGVPGEVIVTSLARWTMPFIRYRLGDVAALDPRPCPCGRPTPRLVSLEGRVQDFLIARSGAWVSPGALQTDLVHGREAILDFRIVQEAADFIRVWIVPSAAFGDGESRRIVEVLQRHLGEIQVAVESVDRIPISPSGKRRRVYRAFSPNE